MRTFNRAGRATGLATAILLVTAVVAQAHPLGSPGQGASAFAPQRAAIHHPLPATATAETGTLRHIGRVSGTESLPFYPGAIPESTPPSTGFDWADAALGAGIATLALTLALLAGVRIRGRRLAHP